MTRSSVPFTDVPARPWLSADAARWASVRVPVWARPVAPAAVLLAAVLTAMLMAPARQCTVAAPCRVSWIDAAGTMAFLPHLLWLFVLPEAVLVSTPLLLLYMSQPGQWQGGPVAQAADAVVVAALCWSAAAVVVRLRARRRQRSLVRDAAGGLTAAVPRPDAARLVRRGMVRYVAGALACAAAGALITSVVLGNRADDQLASTATAQVARVLTYSSYDYALTVRLADGTRHRFGVLGGYRNMHTVRVLVHGSWVRLASEPYGDETVRQGVALALAGFGLTLLGSGLFSRSRAAALRRARVPVLRVLTRRHQGRTEIFAADDALGLRPVLAYLPHADARATLRQALLYGAVSEGGELVLASTTEAGQWLVDTNVSPIRIRQDAPPAPRKPAVDRPAFDWPPPDRPPPERPPLGQPPFDRPPLDRPPLDQPSFDRSAGPHTSGTPGGKSGGISRKTPHREAAESRVRHALATMIPATGPVRWQAGPVARIAAVAFLVVGSAVLVPVVVDPQPWWQTVIATVWGWFVVESSGRMMTWRITADATGLHARGLLQTNHLPWADVSAVVYTQQGELIIRCLPGVDDIRVGGLGFPVLEGRLGRPGRAAYAAAELTAMVRDPALRPKSLPVTEV